MHVVYKFSCGSCNACYVSETILLRASVSTYTPTDLLTFSNICSVVPPVSKLDSAATKFQVKLKESMYIKWEKPDLNQQAKHINLILLL